MGRSSDADDALEALGAGALRGPAEAAWDLFERAWPAVLRRLDAFERSLGVPREFLEDCGQAVLLRVWRFRTSYRGHSAAELAGWMHRICSNEAARHVRKTGRDPRPESSLAFGDADAGPGPIESALSRASAERADPTGESVAATDELNALAECLERLEVKQREVVELLFGAEETSERAIAQLLGRSKSYVNDLRRAALGQLARCLTAKGIE